MGPAKSLGALIRALVRTASIAANMLCYAEKCDYINFFHFIDRFQLY